MDGCNTNTQMWSDYYVRPYPNVVMGFALGMGRLDCENFVSQIKWFELIQIRCTNMV
jgi:hypothetical protein